MWTIKFIRDHTHKGVKYKRGQLFFTKYDICEKLIKRGVANYHAQESDGKVKKPVVLDETPVAVEISQIDDMVEEEEVVEPPKEIDTPSSENKSLFGGFVKKKSGKYNRK